MTDKQQKIYDLIARSLIRIIFKPVAGEKTKIITTVEGEKFKSDGIVITDKQCLNVNGLVRNDKEETMPAVKIDDEVSGEYYLKGAKQVLWKIYRCHINCSNEHLWNKLERWRAEAA